MREQEHTISICTRRTCAHRIHARAQLSLATRSSITQSAHYACVRVRSLYVVCYIQILTYHPAVGQIVIVLQEMIYSSMPMVLFMFMGSVATGAALSFGLPVTEALHSLDKSNMSGSSRRRRGFRGDDSAGTEVDLPEVHTGIPFLAGFWAILGDTEFARDVYGVSPTARNEFNWLPLLVFFQAFFVTIFLVNLMIAKMTSTYERIVSKSFYYRALQRAEFVVEFKDERGFPPPLNILTLWRRLLPRHWVPHCCRDADPPHGFSVPMGPVASVRLHSQERHYVQAFEEKGNANAAMRTDARVAAIHADLPTIRSLGKRCEAIEAELSRLRAQNEVSTSPPSILQSARLRNHHNCSSTPL